MKIFIDTNSYYSQKFNFDSITILATIKYCEGFGVHIIVPKVQKMEIEKKIRDYSKEIETKHLYNLRKIWVYKSITSIHKGFLQKKLQKSFDSFLKRKVVISGDIKNIEINDIVKRYCNCRPPFTSEKPKEFMDAIILFTAISIDNKLLLVSKDEGMKEVAKEHSCLFFNDITSMLNYLFTSKKLLPSYLSKKAMEIWPQIEKKIKNKYEGLWVYSDVIEDDLVADELDLEVDDKVELIGISGKCYTVAYIVRANYHVSGTYADEECCAYDSEDKVFIPFEYKEYDGQHDVTGKVIAEIEIDPQSLSVSQLKLVDTKSIELEKISIQEDYY